MNRSRATRALVAAAAALVVAVPFFAATTFIGDDHLFLAFARYAPNPLAAFVRDQHGGEFYRPLPLTVWWLLGRMGGASPIPFAVLALALHASAAALLAALVASLGRPRAVAWLAGVLFLVAPQSLEAAYWYSASTDLFAGVFVLGALVAAARRRLLLASLLALAAYVSKESALALPALTALILVAAPASGRSRGRDRAVLAAQLLLALTVAAVRRRVLGGWGGSGDHHAGPVAKLLQLASGFAHLGTGAAVFPELVAWGAGTGALALIVAALARRARGGDRAVLTPLVFALIAVAPTLAAPWIVGARYFYLPAAGLAWSAAEALSGTVPAARIVVVTGLLALGTVQADVRRADVVSYDRRVAATRRAVTAQLAQGHRVFHVDGGIKDIDLAVKEDPALRAADQRLLVLGDVPASFAAIPPDLEGATTALVAAPPLPPSGAYRFGDRRIVGLARRGDEPALDEVIATFPDIRFLRLRPSPGGHLLARDVTDEVRAALQ
jgi:hypothetical protein